MTTTKKTFAEAVKGKYCDDAEEELVCFGAKKVEMVGMDKMQAKFRDLARLRIISLRDEGVGLAGEPGEIAALTPNLMELDLSYSNIDNWQTVLDICKQLPRLRILDVSCNKFTMPDSMEGCTNVARLVLNKTETTWDNLLQLSPFFPQLQELHFEGNQVSEITTPTEPHFPNLRLINLENNQLASFGSLSGITTLPKLETLILSDNKLTELPTQEGEHLNQITALSVEKNSVCTKAIRSLSSYSTLKTLRITLEDIPSNVAQQRAFIVPRLPQLTNLNGSSVSDKERINLEKLQLRQSAQALNAHFSVIGHEDDCSDVPEEFLSDSEWRWPRYIELVKKYGNPLPKPDPNDPQGACVASAIGTVKITLKSHYAPNMEKEKEVSVPVLHTVGKLKQMCQKHFGLAPANQQLIARISDDNASKTEVSYCVSLDDEYKDLGFYCVMSGTVVEMHEVDPEEIKRKKEAERKEKEDSERRQLEDANHMIDMEKQRQKGTIA
eukprot:TRINITY_DN52342_c0_g1_i1.p1 TRINITY_DN52342_c0_g1~~TRINITY_DN52342_c0_g1_i1.p1  ORF type:complete len:497 (+),score=66.54 TRINITY_DN52342_c0_g1_i1:19-1509(+)